MTHDGKEAEKSGGVVYYYLDNGLIVFTEAYHLKRGFCCKHGCRHCPYGFKKGAGPTKG